MKFRILGPMEVEDNGFAHTPSAPLPRRVLALLLGNSNRAVPTSALMEELWGQDLPPSALTTLQTYISQLRRMLMKTSLCEGARVRAHRVLVTKPLSYQLNLPAGALDLDEFRQLSAAGQEALERGELERASRLLQEALDLFRGPVLSDVHCGALLRVQAMQLDESRLTTLEARIEADMRMGRHRQLVGELTALTTKHPMHEGLHLQLMLALAHSGRRSEALNTYHRLRGTLVEQLGLEPSWNLKHAHQAVLEGAEEPPLHAELAAHHHGAFR